MDLARQRREAALLRYQRDQEYRRALGIEPGEKLPKAIGVVVHGHAGIKKRRRRPC